MTSEPLTLDGVQFIMLTTVSAPGGTHTRVTDVITRVERVHDVTAVLQQVSKSDPGDPVEVVSWSRTQLAKLPRVSGNVLGCTVVLFARVSSVHRATAAHAVLGAWTSGRPGVVRGGELAPGMAVYTATDPGILVVLCDPNDEADRESSARLYGPLRLAETLAHKVAAQQREYTALRGRAVRRAVRPGLRVSAHTLGR